MTVRVEPTMLRRINERRIMNALRLKGSMSKAELQREVNLTVPTVARLVDGLVRQKCVRERLPSPDKAVGRPAMMIDIDADQRVAIGLELGRDVTRIVFVNLLGEIVLETSMPSSRVQHDEALITSLMETLEESDWDVDNVIGVGIAAPGSLNPHPEKQLFVVQDVQDHHWHHESITDKITRSTGLPAYIENDANAAALGELWFGAGRGVNDLVFVLHDIGIGAGMVINGHIYSGEHNVAGELAHMIVDVDGEVLCFCGRPGCLGGYAPASYLIRAVARRKKSPDMTVSAIVKSAQQGIQPEKSVIETMLNRLAAALVNMIQLVDPSKIVIGGSAMLEDPYLFDELRRRVIQWTAPEDIDMVVTVFGHQAVAFGAATMVLKNVFSHSQLVGAPN